MGRGMLIIAWALLAFVAACDGPHVSPSNGATADPAGTELPPPPDSDELPSCRGFRYEMPPATPASTPGAYPRSPCKSDG